MAAYRYKALNARGATVEGVTQGDSPRDARSRLRAQGWVPLDIRAADDETPSRGGVSWRKLRSGDLASVTRHLSTLLLSGMPLDMALQAAATQTEKPRVATLLLGVRSRVMEGQSLSKSLAAYPRAFNELYCAMVRAGEESGRLGEVLEHLAEYTESRQYARQRVQASLWYPAALLGVAVGVVGLLMVYVVPKLVQLFQYNDAELPALTRGLMALSHFLAHGGALGLVIGIVLLVASTRYALRDPGRRLRWHALCLRLPVVANTLKTVESARFTGTLGVLSASGVPLATAMRIATGVIHNTAMRDAARQALKHLESGGQLSSALKASGVFPPMTVHMIASGELSGELDKMLQKVADHQERQLSLLTQSWMALLEPAITLVMGGVVLLIVLAILIPIFDMNTLVR